MIFFKVINQVIITHDATCRNNGGQQNVCYGVMRSSGNLLGSSLNCDAIKGEHPLPELPIAASLHTQTLDSTDSSESSPEKLEKSKKCIA